MKQWTMAEKFDKFDPKGRIESVIGDVRDKARLNRIVNSVDYIVHAAATKIVPTAMSVRFGLILPISEKY